MDKIVIWTDPTAPFQRIYVIQNGELKEQLGVQFDDVEETFYALVDKYNIFYVEFPGTLGYAEKLIHNIQKNEITRYGQSKIIFGLT